MTKNKKLKKIKRIRKRIQERKNQEKQIQESKETFYKKMEEKFEGAAEKMIFQKSKKIQMSDVIFDFADPLLDEAENGREERDALITAVKLWNVSLLPEEKHLEEKKEILEKSGSLIFRPDIFRNDTEMFDYFMKRKKEMFSQINRYIVDYECYNTPKRVQLNVASAEYRSGLERMSRAAIDL